MIIRSKRFAFVNCSESSVVPVRSLVYITISGSDHPCSPSGDLRHQGAGSTQLYWYPGTAGKAERTQRCQWRAQCSNHSLTGCPADCFTAWARVRLAVWYPSLPSRGSGQHLSSRVMTRRYFYLHVTELELFSVEGQSRLQEAVPFRLHPLLVTY